VLASDQVDAGPVPTEQLLTPAYKTDAPPAKVLAQAVVRARDAASRRLLAEAPLVPANRPCM
jgi:hypothetical protein